MQKMNVDGMVLHVVRSEDYRQYITNGVDGTWVSRSSAPNRRAVAIGKSVLPAKHAAQVDHEILSLSMALSMLLPILSWVIFGLDIEQGLLLLAIMNAGSVGLRYELTRLRRKHTLPTAEEWAAAILSQ